MANIPVFTPRQRVLTPESKGQEAIEIAGRRIGPLYNQAAQDIRERGQIAAEGIKQRIWPYDMLALYDRTAGSGGGVSFRVVGGSGSGGSSTPRTYADHSRAGNGVRNFAGLANGLIRGGGPSREEIGSDEDTIMRYTQTLEGGNLIWRDNATGRQLNKPQPGPNAEAYDNAAKWYDQQYKEQQIYGPTAVNEEGYPSDYGGGGELVTPPATEDYGGSQSWWGSWSTPHYSSGSEYGGL